MRMLPLESNFGTMTQISGISIYGVFDFFLHGQIS